jgi:SNF2 family DNA or RNA helicase
LYRYVEAHKLKDVNSQTTQAVMDIGYEWLLLLTGTPIQNNVRELFGMMHVLDPEQYPSWVDFQEQFCDGGAQVDAAQVMRLREVLRPRMLRRMKEDVETIPAKEEIVVWVELTPEQRNYYRMIYEKQVHVLMEGSKSKNVPQLRNLCMELRKVCNHPFLCNGLEQDYADKKRRSIEAAAAKAAAEMFAKAEAAGLPAPDAPAPPAMPSPLDLLTGSSGKMVLISKLLPKLKKDGHKVLIFSQFTIVLDLLEDYLHMMNYEFERLDGSTSQADRQAGIDRFNTPGQGFVYLLSTRAGGMGITLTAADTAIIYDSDWNPQNDLQAMARCHRIGQTKEVKVYRLVTKATYEQSLFETSAKKYGLDEAVLGGGDVPGVSGGEGGGGAKADAKKINDLLKFGVHGALRDASGEEAAAFAAEDIDQILSGRAEHRAIGSRVGNTFSVATFSVGAESENVDAEKFWEEALPDAVKAAREVGLYRLNPVDP